MPAPTYDPDKADLTLTINGTQLRRINGTWTGRSMAGTWEPALRIGAVRLQDVLDTHPHARPHQTGQLDGQTALELTA